MKMSDNKGKLNANRVYLSHFKQSPQALYCTSPKYIERQNFSNPVITMWVKLEGKPDFEEVVVEKSDYQNNNPNVHNLKTLLRKRIEILKDIQERDIELFAFSSPTDTKFIPADTTLESLDVKGSTKILARYPLSNLSSK